MTNPLHHTLEIDLANFLEELLEDSTPQEAKFIDLRQEERPARTLPAMVVPIVDGEPQIAQTSFVVTKNLSIGGMAFIAQAPIEVDEVIIGLWHGAQCCFTKGSVRYKKTIEGGFEQVGIAFLEMVDAQGHPSLRRLSVLAERLTTPAN